MGKFIITEEEKKHIMGLYEQVSGTTTTTTVNPNNPIVAVQKKLNLTPDGIMNDSTKQAIIKYKTQNNLQPFDDRLTNSLWRSLGLAQVINTPNTTTTTTAPKTQYQPNTTQTTTIR